ncbi:hypothetical protein N7507_008642 [Penicillium longicatenatum]|nr:hypothetical protein N7507_008642 [Penicillium longicatenatum]
MDSSNFDVAMQLFLDDIAKIESTQKGKGRAGELSDNEYAIQCMKNNLLSIKTAKDDRSVALSTLRAATTDANALAFIRKDEIIALNDHQYALALERGENPDSALPNTMKRQQNIDTVSLGMGYLTSRMKEEDLVDNYDGLSPVGIQKKKVTCTCCLEQREDIAFSGRCGHHYCHDCTRRLIFSTRSEALYPPRCCGQVLPPIVVITVLSYEELRVFSNKAIEYNTTSRMYCADPKCSQFIPHYAIEKGNATCKRCSKITHQPCLSLAHPGVRCSVNGTRREIFEMARTEKWRRCSKCKNMVELSLGCNHITCMYAYSPHSSPQKEVSKTNITPVVDISSATFVDQYGIHVTVPCGMRKDLSLECAKKWRTRSPLVQMRMFDGEPSTTSTTNSKVTKQTPASITKALNGFTAREES